MSKFEDYDRSAAEFVRTWPDRASRLELEGLYDPANEHEACGVGLIAAIDGKPRRSVVEAGINALKAVWHRGAVDADGKTGDGAGIHVQIPQDFFKEHNPLALRDAAQRLLEAHERQLWENAVPETLDALEASILHIQGELE